MPDFKLSVKDRQQIQNQMAAINKLPELRTRARDVGAMAEKFGTIKNPSDQKRDSLFWRAIDILARPNYASAGFADEIAQGNGLDEAFARAGREFFSGVGPLEGDKETFSKVLEDAGVGEMGTLSEAIPSLFDDKGLFQLTPDGAFDVTGRGTVGLVLDFALSADTYVSFGTTAGAKVGGKLVQKSIPTIAGRSIDVAERIGGTALSRTGRKQLKQEITEGIGTTGNTFDYFKASPEVKGVALKQAIDDSVKFSDDLSISQSKRATAAIADVADIKLGSPAYRALEKDVREMVGARILEAAKTNPKLLDAGGIKWMGRTIPGTPRLATITSGVSPHVVKAFGKLPGGQLALNSVASVRPLFDNLGMWLKVGWQTRKLPGYNALKQSHIDALASYTTLLNERISNSVLAKLPNKEYKAVVEAIDEGLDPTKLSPTGREAFTFLTQEAAMLEQLEKRLGILDKSRPNYIPHFYENTQEEMAKIRANFGIGDRRGTIGRHNEARIAATLREAVKRSKAAHAADSSIPILKPIYDPVEILRRRFDAHANGVVFDSWYKTLADEFGTKLPTNIDDAVREFSHTWGKLSAKEFNEVTRAMELSAKRLHKLPAQSINKLRTNAARGYATIETLRHAAKKGRKDYFKVLDRFDKAGLLLNLPESIALRPSIGDEIMQAVPGAKRRLKDIHLPKSIVQDIVRMDVERFRSAETGAILRAFDTYTNWMKLSLTQFFPSFHVRNAYSNTMQSFLAIGTEALNPLSHGRTAKILGGVDGTLVTDIGTRYTYKEIRDQIQDQQIQVTGRQLQEATGKETVNLTRKKIFKVADPRTYAGIIETEARAQLYITLLRRGVDPSEAARQVKKFLFDYASLTPEERKFFRRIVPFWTWTRNNIALQAESLIKRPQQLSKLTVPFRERTDEREMLSYWEEDNLRIRINRDNRTLSAIGGIELPLRDIERIWGGSWDRLWRDWLSSTHPIFGLITEEASGTSFFTGQPLNRNRMEVLEEVPAFREMFEGMPKGMRDWLGYSAVTDGRGERVEVDARRFKALSTVTLLSRVFSEMDKGARLSGEEGVDKYTAILSVATGLEPQQLNLDVEQARRFRQYIKETEERLVRRNVMQQIPITYDPTSRRQQQQF